MWGTHIHLRRRFVLDDIYFFVGDCPTGGMARVIMVAGILAAYFQDEDGGVRCNIC
jgi:hypothetical protein